MFRPWKGSEYEITRLLLLGESVYSWWEEDELKHPSLNHSCESVEWAISKFPKCGRFFAMVSRALAGEEAPTKQRLQSVWNRVAFTNYVSLSVGDAARVRPTSEMWAEAHEEFLPQISQLKPKRIIVIGKELWEQMPPTISEMPPTGFVAGHLDGYRIGDEVAMCFPVEHPGGGLSWQKLAKVIHFTYERELRPTNV